MNNWWNSEKFNDEEFRSILIGLKAIAKTQNEHTELLSQIKGEIKKMADNTDAVLKPISDALVALQTEMTAHNTALTSIEADLQALAAAGSQGQTIDPTKVQAIADAVSSVTAGLAASDATVNAAAAAAQPPAAPVTPATPAAS